MNFFSNQSKNGIYRVKALDELIIFAIHQNFQNAYFGLWRPLKCVQICKKWLFFNFNWVGDMGCAKWPHGSGEYFYYSGRPSPTLILRDMGPWVVQNNLKSSEFFVFVYLTWGVQSNGHLVGIIFGIRIDSWTLLFLGRIGPIVWVSLVFYHSKYCLFPKGEKIGPLRPNEPLADQFFRASLTQTLINEEPSRASAENALAF
jgi:hypothetical protein